MHTRGTLNRSAADERQIVVKDGAKQILAALDRLPLDERQATVTAYYGQCRDAAIALGESERTVKLCIRSGLRRLAMLNEALGVSPALAVGDGS